MATFSLGYFTYGLEVDSEGYKTYKVHYLVGSTTPLLDSPEAILNTPGLPLTGSIYAYGNDVNPYAFCRPEVSVRIHQERQGDIHPWWEVIKTFSTKPFKKCTENTFDNPLMEPQKVSGSFVKYTEEAVTDRNGNLLVNSAYEQFRGSKVEFDNGKPSVRIEQNVQNLELPLLASLMNNLNDSDMWGLSTRKVKLSDIRWERKILGTCSYYYTRVLDFDIDFNTFDRVIVDEGTKALNGHWNEITGAWQLDHINGVTPDPEDPTHFIRVKDLNGENMRVLLNGSGQPLTNGASPFTFTVEKYPASNLFLLGVPTTF